MSELRWILLGIGVIVIAAIWFLSRRGWRREPPAAEPPELTEPVDEDIDLSEMEEIGRALAEEIRADRAGTGDDDSRRKIIVLHVRLSAPEPGDVVATALEAAGLELGHMNIHHYHESGSVQFSAANMVEPGTFSDAPTPGFTLFSVLTGEGGTQALDLMLECANALAAELDGEVLDERHSALTRQTVQHLREQVALFETRLRAGVVEDGT